MGVKQEEEIQIVGLENKCMASCSQRGTEEISIDGQDFLFCKHHDNKLRPAIEAYEDHRSRIAFPVGTSL